jgi:hypothetical protein
MSDLACRACKQSLMADVRGCGICGTIRKHLILQDTGDEDRPSLTQVSSEMVKMLRDRHRYFATELKDKPGSETLGKGFIANTNAMTKLLEAARRLQSDGLAAVEAMSWMDRAKLFIQWYASLPPALRGRVREQMGSFEKVQALPSAEIKLLPPAEE